MARRLDHRTRQSIARKLRDGVHPRVLARDHGVSTRTIYRCAELMRQIGIERGSRTEVVMCRVSPADLARFDARLKAAGLRNRSAALRNVIRNAGGVAAPDADLAEALTGMRGALNKVGNNVSQIARRMNDARNRGQPVPFSEEDHAAIRQLSGLVLDFADQVGAMAEGRRDSLDLKIADVLKRLAERGV